MSEPEPSYYLEADTETAQRIFDTIAQQYLIIPNIADDGGTRILRRDKAEKNATPIIDSDTNEQGPHAIIPLEIVLREGINPETN